MNRYISFKKFIILSITFYIIIIIIGYFLINNFFNSDYITPEKSFYQHLINNIKCLLCC